MASQPLTGRPVVPSLLFWFVIVLGVLGVALVGLLLFGGGS
jgi:hypothetical protein